jgi:phage N-6-adenine-methyltransferase
MAHKRNSNIATQKDSWETPQHIFDKLDQEFHFTLDAAANSENTKCTTFLDESVDALLVDWCKYARGGNIWLNPPYSKGNVARFLQKAYVESEKGMGSVVCLIPVDFSTNWWHNYVMNANAILAIKGRVKFIGYDDEGNQIKNSPTFSSCIAIFKKSRFTQRSPEKITTLTVF